MTFDPDLWLQQMRIPILYLGHLFEIYQSTWKVEPNVNLFSQQQQHNRRQGQSDPYVFPGKAGDTKKSGVFWWHLLNNILKIIFP